MKKSIIIITVLYIILLGCAGKPDLPDRIPSKYEGFYNLTKYVLTDEEFEEFLMLSEKEQEEYIIDFWERTDPSPGSMSNEFRDLLLERTRDANEQFSFGRTMGSDTDRGKIYIMYGPPDEIDQRDYDREYDRDLRHLGQRREQEADIAGDHRKQKNYEYWTYENTYGLRPNTTLTFVDDYATGQYKLLTNLNAHQDRNVPNPLRTFLTEEGRIRFQKSFDTSESPIMHRFQDGKEFGINLDHVLLPSDDDNVHLFALLYLPFRNLVFIEDDLRNSVAIIQIEAVFKEGYASHNRIFREEIKIPQNTLQSNLANGSYLISLDFIIPSENHILEITVTDIRTRGQGEAVIEIPESKEISIGGIKLDYSSMILSALDESRIFTHPDYHLVFQGEKFTPVYGNVYARTAGLKLYQEIRLLSDIDQKSFDFNIIILSKDTGRKIYERALSQESLNNKVILEHQIDTASIGTGHYEIIVLYQDEKVNSKYFYFLR